MPDESKGAFSCTSRDVKVARVVASTTVVDMDYSRVEVEIDGELYEFSGPDAQVLGAQINTAGGGDMFAKSGHETENVKLRRDLKALITAVGEERGWATGTENHNKARSALYALAEASHDAWF